MDLARILRIAGKNLQNAGVASVMLLALLLTVGVVINELNGGKVFWPGYLAMMGFYVLIFYIAIRAARKGSREHMLAGRSLPLWLGVFTMSATWIGGGFINGTAEYTYSEGLLWVQAPWGYALSLVIGGLIFAGPMRLRNYTTMLDPLEEKFGRSSNLLFFIPALLGDLFWTSAILVALGTTFGTILGLDLVSSIILSGGVVIVYTAAGGLWSVAITDVFQLIILLAGLALVAWTATGSWTDLMEVINQYGRQYGDKAWFWPRNGVLGAASAQWWDGALLLVFGGIPWQVYFQRVLASKDARTARNLSLWAGLICLLAAIPPVLIGIIASTTDWGLSSLPELQEASSVLPHVIKHLTNPVVATVGLGAIAAAVMSSADSSILASSSVIVWNVFPRKIANEPQNRMRMIRRIIWVVGLTTILIALNVRSIYQLWFLCSDLVYCLLFPLLVTALFDPRANRTGAYCGFLIALLLRLGGGDPVLGIAPLIPYPQVDGMVTIPFKTLSMLTGLLTIMLVSRIFPSGPAADTNDLTA